MLHEAYDSDGEAKPIVSVIIPAYNEEGYIENALRSVSRQSLDRRFYEILVVDGGSKDNTIEIASKYADKIILQTGKGVGQARNQGAATSRGRILVHTDSDVIVPDKWLERICSIISREGVIAVCGPNYPIERSLTTSMEFAFMNISSLTHRLGIVVTRGTNTAVFRSAFEQVGGYSNITVLDDVELGYRLKKIGKIVCSREAAVWTSARRFKKKGFWATRLSWTKGDIMILTGMRFEEDYARQDY